MRKIVYSLCLPLVISLIACGGKSKKENESMEVLMRDSVNTHGVQYMQTSKAEADIQFNGKTYHSIVTRTPDERMPHVTNEMGDTYADNKITIRLTRGADVVLDKAFVKGDFVSVAGEEFLSKAILEGIVYDKTTSAGMIYAGSVCYPQTDLYIPFTITVLANGKMVIEKVDMLEEVYEAEAN